MFETLNYKCFSAEFFALSMAFFEVLKAFQLGKNLWFEYMLIGLFFEFSNERVVLKKFQVIQLL